MSLHPEFQEILVSNSHAPFGVRFQTNFQAALDAVRAHVHPKPHDRVRVLFMTDGMANRGDSVAGLRDFTRWACDEKDTVVSVDVMAFQTSDNIQFLDKLRCAGNVEGIYRSAVGSMDIVGLVV